ncbi:MAG: porphobilinogen synthase [Proteobacteria bacterium]|nr:porphobilinogen synthase [Pseudomonadota bacterium]
MSHFLGNFPSTRLRRLRSTPWIRQLVSETALTVDDLILPLFVREPEASPEIESLPGIYRYTINELPEILEKAARLGILCVAIFPYVQKNLRDEEASEALNPDNLMCRAIRQIAYHAPHMGIIADVALDPYTSHGHDGILINNAIDNDETVAVLCRQALIQSEAGAHIIAPSDMMDGRVGAIRQILDTQGFQDQLILSYSVKYASHFYGPFRDAVGVSALQGLKDKKTYQLNPANALEALREAAQDITEGADMIMVKPALAYLDIIYRYTTTYSIPVFAYQVSGEYALFRHYPNKEAGFNMMMESLISIKRAGARAILTYAALEVAEFLKGQQQ